MHVRLAILFALLAALWAAPAHAASSPAGVRMLSCTAWEERGGGSVTYAAHMDAVPGTARMSLRIRLFQRFGDGRFERVSADRLGVWRKSRPGASAFRWKQSVDGLHRGAAYRVVVRYRWHHSDGDVFQRARRKSARCSQGGGLPNLRVASIRTRRGDVEGTAVYKAKIVNDGIAEARRVGVLLRVDGEVVDEAEMIDALEPGDSRTVTFNGPVCRNRLRMVVDPRQLVPESRERDNVLARACL